ncbi:MAG: hypothetical protein V6Z81_05010 [Parvularculales bacterium]
MSYKDDVSERLWAWAQRKHEGQLDGIEKEGRPPVLLKEFEAENILIAPDGLHAEEVRAAIPKGKRHRWFRSLRSSQALAQSVFANVKAYGRLDLLQSVRAECGRPAFYHDNQSWTLDLEQKITTLNEPRPTEIDVLFQSSDRRVAVECKFMETEFGTCSRTGLSKDDAQYCNGNYEIQQSRKERCALTEIEIKYWQYLPELFDWSSDMDYAPCPFGETYQLARNALAAMLSPTGEFDLTSGHMLIVYDQRNPAFQTRGSGEQQWQKALASCRVPGLLRRISWQRLLSAFTGVEELKWLPDELEQKYGFLFCPEE